KALEENLGNIEDILDEDAGEFLNDLKEEASTGLAFFGDRVFNVEVLLVPVMGPQHEIERILRDPERLGSFVKSFRGHGVFPEQSNISVFGGLLDIPTAMEVFPARLAKVREALYRG